MSAAATPEFSRTVRADTVGTAPRREAIEADEAERAALAQRFGLAAVDALTATFEVRREAAGIRASGRVAARVVQTCVVSGEPVPASIDEPVDLRFVEGLAPAADGEEEVELSADDCDLLPLEGGRIDLGEAAAETVSLALDPYPRADAAVLEAARATLLSEEEAEAREAAEKAARNPFAKLLGA